MLKEINKHGVCTYHFDIGRIRGWGHMRGHRRSGEMESRMLPEVDADNEASGWDAVSTWFDLLQQHGNLTVGEDRICFARRECRL